MKRIWIRAKSVAPEAQRAKKALKKAFESKGAMVPEEFESPCDLCICVGGDGTVLAAVREMGEARFQVPILAVHASWGLGFLQSISAPDLDPHHLETEPGHVEMTWAEKVVNAFAEGRYKQESRWGLTAELHDKNDAVLEEDIWALNDVVVNKGAISRLVLLKVSVDDTVLLERLRGDGLIISSATGSTAYSLSAGGPILEPTLPSLIVMAICPHEVAQRPLVLDGSKKLCIDVLEHKMPCFLTSDGQRQIEVHAGQRIHVKGAETPLKWLTLKAPELQSKNYFELLRTKLHYGGN